MYFILLKREVAKWPENKPIYFEIYNVKKIIK